MLRKNLKNLGFAVCLLLGEFHAAPAQADIEIGFFGGAKFYSDDGALGRSLIRDMPEGAFRNSAILGLRLGYLPLPRLALEAELGVSPTGMRGSLRYPNGAEVPLTQGAIAVIPLRAHLLLNLLTGHFRPFLLLGGGGHLGAPFGPGVLRSDAAFALHAGVGFTLCVRDSWGIRLDGRYILAQGLEQPLTSEGEVLFSFYNRFGPAPPPRLPAPSAAPAPPPPPAPPAPPAPPPPPLDSDQDGVPDAEDRCPNVPGPRTTAGCPEGDRDHDGIVDSRDKCPDAPETYNNYQDEDGCPDELPPELTRMTGVIAGISFAPSSAVIAVSSYKVLDEAVKMLSNYPSVRIEIAGYTDISGDPDVNLRLSDERARAVRDYLVGKGISLDRLQAKGYGASSPIADNASSAGRAKNRRVEFHVLPSASTP